ncbi:MAG TPA: Rid family detoxifying hydrolase [Candidatus Babeliaceae bacterium]|nr:Rid family detoxifying hydrolase [Candidatus Babeliaceae bacterium]
MRHSILCGLCALLPALSICRQHKESIQTDQAPMPIGPYSQAVSISAPRLLFISGQIPLDPETGILHTDLIQATEQVLKNLKAILKQANLDFNNVVKATIFLKDMDDFTIVNSIYQSFFKEVKIFPARETIQVVRLPKDACIEISMIAAY